MDNTRVGYSNKVLLPASDKRSKHEAELRVKWVQVQLKKPENKQFKALPTAMTVTAIEVRENPETVVNKEAPIHWILLSSHPAETPADACRLIQWYSWRWFIEQLFRLLKSRGLDLLSSTLTTYEALSKVSLLALESAVRVLQLVIARDSALVQGVESAFQRMRYRFYRFLVLSWKAIRKSSKILTRHLT